MEKQHVREIDTNLNMNEIHYARNVLGYLQDELNRLTKLAQEAQTTKDHQDMIMVSYELMQQGHRFEDTLNLVDELLKNANDKIEASLQIIAKNWE